MKILTILIFLAFLAACAAPSTLTFSKDGKVTSAANYTITTKDGAYVPYIPDNWFTSAMKQMLETIGPYLAMFKEFFGGQPFTPTPAPTPAPAPRPYP